MKLLPSSIRAGLLAGAFTLTSLSLSSTASASTVLIGEAEATNVRVNAQVSGTLLTLPLLLTEVDVPLNTTSALAPAPAAQSSAVAAVGATSGLLSANIGAQAAVASSGSNVNGAPGIRTTNGLAELESATVGLALTGLPVDLLALSLGGGDGLIITNSSITGDGVDGMQPTAQSNLLATNSTLGIEILGLAVPGINLGALVAGTTATVDFLVDTRSLGTGTLIEGTITLLADETFTNPGAGTDDFFALAEATGLQVGIDARAAILAAGIATTDLQLNTTVVINETSALMLTPEPGKAVLLALGLVGLVFHRRR